MTGPLPPPSVDLAQLAGLVAPLVAAHTTVDRRVLDEVAQRCAEAVIASLAPTLVRIEEATRIERRSIGPYVPPPATTTN